MVDVGFEPRTRKKHGPVDDATCKVIRGGGRVPHAGLPIEQVLGEYSLSFPS